MKYLNIANPVSNKDIPEISVSLIDLSPSMDENDYHPSRKAGALKANSELLKIKLKNSPQDKMGIIGFASKARLLHEPACISEGFDSLQNALCNPRGSCGTNFTAALELARNCLQGKSYRPEGNFFSRMLSEIFIEPDNHKQKKAKDDGSVKRIILLTDGEHNAAVSPLSIASSLKKAGVIIDCIGIGGSPADVDEKLLKKIASKNPDGSVRYCFIGDQQQLIRKYQSLAQHIRVV